MTALASTQESWRAIAAATAVAVVAYGLLLVGQVSAAPGREGLRHPWIAIGTGLVLLPVVFGVLAVLSRRDRPLRAAGKAVGVALLVGVAVSAVAADGVTGIVAAIGAGGVVALRLDDDGSARARAVAVVVATVYVFVLVRTGGSIAVLVAPLLPLTGLGLADLLSARRTHHRPSILRAP
jgi:hypothetical protein